MSSHAASHTKPIAPVAMNAHRQPHVTVIHGTMSGRDDDADVRAGVEDAGCERAFLLWKPLGDRLDRARKIAGLAEAEREPREAEAGDGADDRVAHARQAPDDDRERVGESGADPVEDAAGQQQAEAVREAEPRDDVAVVHLAPAELAAERRRENSQHLAIEVVDGRRRKQQGEDRPAVAEPARRGSSDDRPPASPCGFPLARLPTVPAGRPRRAPDRTDPTPYGPSRPRSCGRDPAASVR